MKTGKISCVRVIVVCLLVSAAVMSSSTPSASCPELSLEARFLCAELGVKDNGDHHAIVVVDWGDGDVGYFDTFNGFGSFPHKYLKPGTYRIQATAYGCGTGEGVTNSITAEVQGAPQFNLDVVENGSSIQPATVDSVQPALIQRSTVDWGDGAPIAEFEWANCDPPGTLCAPAHVYATAGVYSIVIRNQYLTDSFGCSSVSTSSVQVTIGVPVQSQTWGAIKSLYR